MRVRFLSKLRQNRLHFVDQVAIGTLLLALITWSIVGKQGLPLFLGAMWGSANLLLIKQLVKQLFLTENKNYLKIVFLIALKCPLLYFTGYILLKIQFNSIIYVLFGFSLLILTMILIGLKENLKKRT